jgi:hypothetical protein
MASTPWSFQYNRYVRRAALTPRLTLSGLSGRDSVHPARHFVRTCRLGEQRLLVRFHEGGRIPVTVPAPLPQAHLMTTSALRNFIAGAFAASASAPDSVSINPSDDRDIVGLVPAGAGEDVAAASSAAADALPGWRRTPGPARAEALHRWAGVIQNRAEELAQAMSREVGKPIGEARGDVARCVVILRDYAGEAVRAVGDVVPAQAAGLVQ